MSAIWIAATIYTCGYICSGRWLQWSVLTNYTPAFYMDGFIIHSIYVYTYILSIHTYIYICVCVCMYVHICTFVKTFVT